MDMGIDGIFSREVAEAIICDAQNLEVRKARQKTVERRVYLLVEPVVAELWVAREREVFDFVRVELEDLFSVRQVHAKSPTGNLTC